MTVIWANLWNNNQVSLGNNATIPRLMYGRIITCGTIIRHGAKMQMK